MLIVELECEFDCFGVIRYIDYEKGDDYVYILYDSLDVVLVVVCEMCGFLFGGCDWWLKIDFVDKDYL